MPKVGEAIVIDSLKDVQPAQIFVSNGLIFKIERRNKEIQTIEYEPDPSDAFKCEFLSARAVPPGWVSGELDRDLFWDVRLCRLVEGSREYFKKNVINRFSRTIDVDRSLVGQGYIKPPLAKVDGARKIDLICYVIDVVGPLLRDDVLRKVAAIEGKPWVPTSNHEYFQNVAPDGERYGELTKAGKLGRKQLYGLNKAGRELAKPLRRLIGDAFAEDA